MTHPNKAKGNKFEVEIVKKLQEHGLEARRAWGSNGQSLGKHEEVDILMKYKHQSIIEELKLQCKRKKELPEWLGLTEHVDAVILREDRGKTFILMNFEEFTRRFL